MLAIKTRVSLICSITKHTLCALKLNFQEPDAEGKLYRSQNLEIDQMTLVDHFLVLDTYTGTITLQLNNVLLYSIVLPSYNGRKSILCSFTLRVSLIT